MDREFIVLEILWFAQTIASFVVIVLAYKEGEKRASDRIKFLRKNRRYNLDNSKRQREFLEEWNGVQGGRKASREMQRSIKRYKTKRRR